MQVVFHHTSETQERQEFHRAKYHPHDFVGSLFHPMRARYTRSATCDVENPNQFSALI